MSEAAGAAGGADGGATLAVPPDIATEGLETFSPADSDAADGRVDVSDALLSRVRAQAEARSSRPAQDDDADEPDSRQARAAKSGKKSRAPRTPAAPDLPGVMPDAEDDVFESLIEDHLPADTAGRPRDAQGHFLPTKQAADAPPAAPGETVAPAPFKFAGRDWKDQAEAEQNVRSMQGAFKYHAERSGQYEPMVKLANDWKEAHDRVAAELASYKSGHAPAAAPHDATRAQAASPAGQDSVDWELYGEIEKLAIAAGEPHKARQWLHEQEQAILDRRYQKMLDERTAPLTNDRQAAEVARQVQGVFANAQMDMEEDGMTPRLPELRDVATATQVGWLWTKLGLPADIALSPIGPYIAVAMYRAYFANKGKGASAPAPAAAPAASPSTRATSTAPAEPPAVAPERAAVLSQLGGPEPPLSRPDRSGNNMPPEVADLARTLRVSKSDMARAATLGFNP